MGVGAGQGSFKNSAPLGGGGSHSMEPPPPLIGPNFLSGFCQSKIFSGAFGAP